MTVEELEALFEKHDDEFLKHERIQNPLSARQDLNAFLLLDKLSPSKGNADIVAAAEHDEIYLEVSPEDVCESITEAQVIDLIRCGVRLDGEGFCMFV